MQLVRVPPLLRRRTLRSETAITANTERTMTRIARPRVTAKSDGVPSTPAARWALAALSLSMLMPALDTGIANVGLPTLSRAFGASFQAVQWVVLAYLLAITTLIVGAGRLGDLLGRRRLLLGGIALFTVASLLCGVAPTLAVLIAARAAQGLGAAIMMALTIALVGESVPKARVGSAMGLLGTMSAIGTSLGPSLGGVLIAGFGWRTIFFVTVPLGIAAWALVRHFVPADRRAPSEARSGYDVRGTLLLALTLGAYALAMTVGKGTFGLRNAALLGLAAVGLERFVRTETRAASPLVRLAIFRDATLGAGLTMGALVSTVMMATLVVGPFYLARALGLGAAHVGLAMSAGPLVAALAGVPAGRLVDRFGAHWTTVVGLAGMALGLTMLVMLPRTLGIVGYVAPIVIVTAHYALFQAANNTAVMTGVPADQRGVVSGLLSLSRNLGLLTGASALGAVFALAAGTSDVATAEPAAVAASMRVTFGVAAVLIIAALTLATRRARVLALAVGTMAFASVARSQSASAGRSAPTPGDRYPLAAAGWGPATPTHGFVSRWAEDWTGMRAAGAAPRLKAIPLGDGASLTLSAELRLRHAAYDNALLRRGDDFRQTLVRGVAGADLRLNANARVYGELASGQVAGRRAVAGPNFQNDAALQQLFVDARGEIGGALVGVMVGRQEFADGPRQLLSVSDGPNLHRTWNGVRVYAHGRRARVGAFDFTATRLGRATFDEAVNRGEHLRGLNASVILAREARAGDVYLDPFWLHTDRAAQTVSAGAGATGATRATDDRDTYGARLWGRRGILAFDWTVARQTGTVAGHDVHAWGAFGVHSVTLSRAAWKPRLTARVDVASGASGAAGRGTLGFNPLYASSNYVGEGQFLSLSNLLLVAPGVSVAPSRGGDITIEYGVARRLREHDDAGRALGGLLRLAATRAMGEHVTLSGDYEQFVTGRVLGRAPLPSGRYGFVGITWRY
jgi:EmrB/QacA subfamily drug resistance transporter